MVNVPLTGRLARAWAVSSDDTAADPEIALAIGYSPVSARAGVEAIFALDGRLAQVLRTTREPLVGQMRLTWWYDGLQRLDTAAPPAEPVLEALARHVLPSGVSGSRMAAMIDAWEELLEEELGDAVVRRHAGNRGGKLFEFAGHLLGAGATEPIEQAGEGWALADLARHLSDRRLAERAQALAAAPLAAATNFEWSRAARPLGALAHIARMNLKVPLDRPLPIGSPRRVGRLLYHRLTGR